MDREEKYEIILRNKYHVIDLARIRGVEIRISYVEAYDRYDIELRKQGYRGEVSVTRETFIYDPKHVGFLLHDACDRLDDRINKTEAWE